MAVRDGQLTYPLDPFFANIALAQVEEPLHRQGLPTDRVTTPYTCLFVDTGEHRITVDTGAGNLTASAPMTFPSVDHATTVIWELLRNLRAARMLHISDVVVSPLHLEHPDWRPIFDPASDATTASKQRIFDYAATEGLPIFGHHVPPFPSLGHVHKHGAG